MSNKKPKRIVYTHVVGRDGEYKCVPVEYDGPLEEFTSQDPKLHFEMEYVGKATFEPFGCDPNEDK